jgi:hypothetical protein
MGLWQRINDWRTERKAEREAIRRSQQDKLRAGEEAAPERDVFEENRLAGSKSASSIGGTSGFDGGGSDV